MTDTLTQIIAKLQILLLDDGTRFDVTTSTAAIRQALKYFNLAAPIHAGTLVDTVLGQKEYELDVPTALEIIDVLRQGKDTYAEEHISLDFDRYFEDDRLFFRLRVSEPITNTLIVRYTLPHTISGLDNATDSTLSALADVVLLDGAAWQACLTRAAGRVESINLADKVTVTYRSMAVNFKAAFDFGILKMPHQTFATVPDARTWHDKWKGQY